MRRLLAGATLSVLVFAGVAYPVSTGALSIDELQTQVRELLTRIATLSAQSAPQGAPFYSAVPSAAPKYRICNVLARNLSRGQSGDDVRSLQEFLNGEGYLSATATGYFGPATAAAVAKWQASQGVNALGSFGPLSRERIKLWCGGGNTERFSAEPRNGLSPLTVTFKTNVTLTNPMLVADAGDYKIVFGDGSEQVFSCTSTTGTCPGPQTMQHTYSANGAYTAQLIHYGYFGPADNGNQEVMGSATITVGEQVACTKEYNPVCGAKQVVCIKAPCNPVPQTYGNRCEMNADGATFLYQGSCRDTSGDPSADSRCKAWYDGCNSCSRSAPGEPAMCTLRACTPESMTKPYCTAYFDTSSQNKAPVVSGFSGPTSLTLNEQGTWTIQASDPENGPLSYSVVWGDEWFAGAAAPQFSKQESIVQSSTLTHSYSRAGNYTVSIVVKDAQGLEARTTSSVQVSSTIAGCTKEYKPVCGQPKWYCPPGAYCATVMPGPQTYGNRCEMNAAGASFLYEGTCATTQPVACTADAKQCPDGRWVGRTGSNCEFAC